VLSKYQYRGEGTRCLLTRLPPQGRKRGGGVRLGEQERDGILAHGAVNFLRDRTLVTCDAHDVVVCTNCNNPAMAFISRNIIICRMCQGSDFAVCEQAYTQTLLSNYCAIAGIKMTPIYAYVNDTVKGIVAGVDLDVIDDEEEEEEEENALDDYEDDEDDSYDDSDTDSDTEYVDFNFD
jgi:hypothetical protein